MKVAALLPAAETLGPLLQVVAVETLDLLLQVAVAEILALLQVETMETLALLQVETNFENVDRIDMDTYALPLYNACYVTICIIMKIGECLLLPSID